MQRPPRTRRERLLTPGLLVRAYLFLGVLEAAAAMTAFYFVLAAAGWQPGQALSTSDVLYRQATTACLTAIVLMQVVNVHLCRSRRASIASRPPWENPLITAGIIAEWALARKVRSCRARHCGVSDPGPRGQSIDTVARAMANEDICAMES
jgi:magnesium-transporting ATPase (P-type)